MTLRFALIGSPVTHSKSPAMHAAAYRALGLSHTYERLETSANELSSRVDALRRGIFAGLNVTVPHKTRVISLVDTLDSSAVATGAANTLVRGATGEVEACNTDAPALREELTRLARERRFFSGRSALVLGTGGAARAALFALGQLGVRQVIVRGRRRDPDLEAVLAASGSAASLRFEPLGDPPAAEAEDLAAIVQTTTAGMSGSGVPGDVAADAVRWSTVPADGIVYDVVYAPARTSFLDRAVARGLVSDGGLGMLARQGALAFERWLGLEPPFEVMRAELG